jgi:hypothetical protein
MITHEQWLALESYVIYQLKTKENFALRDTALERMFGITHPFWPQMCEFAKTSAKTYSGDPHWCTSDGEPTEIAYARRPPGATPNIQTS